MNDNKNFVSPLHIKSSLRYVLLSVIPFTEFSILHSITVNALLTLILIQLGT